MNDSLKDQLQAILPQLACKKPKPTKPPKKESK